MAQLTLPMRPEEATKILLKRLPHRRMRDVLEKRFGLKGGRKKTLEAIGREYKITRERVRQIETDALKQLSKSENYREVEGLIHTLEDHVKEHGEVLAENHLLSTLASQRHIPHISFLLHLGKSFSELPETASEHRRWTVNKNTAAMVEKIIEHVRNDLEDIGKPVSANELHDLIAKNSQGVLGISVSEHIRNTYLATSKHIKQNPYGEYGLAQWQVIHPRGVKDKAYLVLTKSGKPMHFREVAEAINKANWSKKKAHPQTVHNELIKDNRFVLVGRGLYGLKDWGFEPGTVRDILV